MTNLCQNRARIGWLTGFVAAALLLAAQASTAATVIVTQTDDVPSSQSPIFGSLRDAIRNRASPGDTIVFDVQGPISLQDDLVIPRELYGLTLQGRAVIQGQAGRAASIQIEADSTTVNDITFRNVSVFAADVRGGIPRRVQDFTLFGSQFQGDAQVSVSDADDCRVTGNQFNVRPQSGNDDALSTSRTARCVVSGNRIRIARGAAFLDEDSEDLQLTDNPQLQGDVWVRASSGDIVGNVVNGALHVYRPDLGASYGHLRVEDNEARSMTVDRTYLSIVRNNLSGTTPGIGGPASALYVQNQEPRGPQGPILIERNTTTGGRDGIQLTHYPTGGDVVIHDNDVIGCTERGVLVESGRNVKITKNRIRQCGSAALGRGIAIRQAGSSGVIAENNEVWDIDGSGIVVAPQFPGIDVVLKGNTIRNNQAPGITLLRNDGDLPGRTRMEDNLLFANAVAGVLAEVNARGSVSGGEIHDNLGAGVLVRDGGKVEVRQVRMGGNAGVGIDIAPEGVTSNADTKSGNRDLDWPEDLSINPTTRKLEGRSAPGSVVEVFTVEDGERAGNPTNGEGVAFLGSATAGPDGLFAFPSTGMIECPATRLLTLTATLEDGSPVTSEFSPDFDCVLPDVPPVDDDDDNDGVNNAGDQCPDTPPGETADANGCAESQKDDDGDSVNNSADQCPATPAGETADANGCAESQKDDDGDGVINSEDKCPGPGSTSAQGCQQVIGIPGLGTFFINVAALSTIQSGQEGESCSDCSVELQDATSHACFGDADVTISGPTAVSSTNCQYQAPALSIDGSGALVSSIVNGGASCEGDAGQCATSADNPTLAGSCGQTSCFRWYSRWVLEDGLTDFTRVVVTKSTVDGDGTFVFVGSPFPEPPLYWNVTTSGGIGDRIAELFFGQDGYISIEETPKPEWSANVLCINSTTGDQLGGTNSVTVAPVASESFTTWQCGFQNTLMVDTDGDGIPDPDDPCPNVAGTNGNGCPVQGDNGFVAYFCNDQLTCSVDQSGGYCSNCVLERLDGTGSCSSAEGGGVCTTRDGNVMECPSGGCQLDTANFSGQCDLGTLCTLDAGFSCSSNMDGTGCAGTITSTAEAIGCPNNGPCNIELTPSVIYRDANAAVKLDVFKQTVGGDGLFTFTWQAISRDPIFGAPFTYDGSFTIETVGNVGREATRFYLDPSNGSDVVVKELDSPGFTLDRLECATSAGLDNVVIGGPGLDGTGIAGQFRAFGENACTFVNVAGTVDPDRVALLPDGHSGGEGVNGRIRPDSFGGQMSTTNPVVAVATGTGQVFIDTATGEVPRAGSDRMSFLGFPSYEVLVQPNADLPGYDTIITAGPQSTATSFDPLGGFFGFTSVGFNNILDIVHVGNDNTSPALVSVDRTLNQVDVLDPPDETGVGFAYQFPLVRPENLQDAAGSVVSAQAFELGQLNCANPCQENLNGIRRGCSVAIDQVLDTSTETGSLAYCEGFWGSECIATFQNQNEGYCSLPLEQQSDFGGMVLVLTDGTPGQVPGQLHLANPASSILDRVRTVGNVGDDPRRVRCLNGVCAVTNFGSNTLTVLTWDGGQDAAITATVNVGDGPIGLDLRQVLGNVVILSTGSRDNTYAVTTVSPFGEVVDNLIQPMPEGCEGPGHIAWVEGTARAFATCAGNDSYAVFTP